MSFREANQVQYVASSELSNANTERTQFANVDATRVPHPTQSGQSACLTNAGKPLGLWKSMPISKGDKINAGVSAYYTQTSSMSSGINWALFPVQNPTYGNNEGGTRPFGLPFSLGVVLLPNPTPSASVPVAYLRMVFYNAQNTIIQQSVRYVGGQNNLWQYYETGNIEALQNGRVEIYVANESVPNVWFDNLTITHTPHVITQENHYYAFGMNAKEIEKEGSNRFQFMGVEKESSFGLDWTETDHRSYDGEVGRFWQVDKLSEDAFDWTSYRYGFNNPISHTDPTGLWEETATGWRTHKMEEVTEFMALLKSFKKGKVEIVNDADEKDDVAFRLIGERGGNDEDTGKMQVAPVHHLEGQDRGMINFLANDFIDSKKEKKQTIDRSQGAGVLEGFIPIWGSARDAYANFSNGEWGWGTLNTIGAISDVFLLKSIGTGLVKGAWKTGSHNWSATRRWYRERYPLQAGQEVHHWLLWQSSNAPKWLKNQPWNLKPIPSVGNLTSKQVHMAVHGWGNYNWNIVQRLYYGTPSYPWTFGGTIITDYSNTFNK